jgi:hypothetical protein
MFMLIAFQYNSLGLNGLWEETLKTFFRPKNTLLAAISGEDRYVVLRYRSHKATKQKPKVMRIVILISYAKIWTKAQ